MEFFERPDAGERVVTVHLEIGRLDEAAAFNEFRDLVLSTGAEIVAQETVVLRRPDPRQLIGSGKAAELHALVEAEKPDLVIFNHELSPSQERNLERLLECRVLDRSGLILDIFASRASSAEGKLQVELAQLKHLSTRLVRGWTHLERQKGGIGLRGPGETQLETDRRLINQRISRIQGRLEKVASRRALSKQARKKAELPVIALVGYTNAGKSTLFNALTQATVLAEDKLFATLDPTLRRIEAVQGMPAILADTVGFISDLPHELVASFRSTLEETSDADLLLHVIDAGSPVRQELIQEVQTVLTRIGADEVPQIQVLNKIDLLDDDSREVELSRQHATRVAVSAVSGEGLDHLLEVIAEHLRRDRPVRELYLAPQYQWLRARIFQHGAVCDEKIDSNGGTEIRFHMSDQHYNRLKNDHPAVFADTSTAEDK